MAVTRTTIADKGASTSSTTHVVKATTDAVAAAVGDLVVVAMDGNNANADTATIADSGGNTWTQETKVTQSTNQTLFIFWCVLTNAIASGGTITITLSAAASRRASHVSKVSGAAGTIARDKYVTNSGTGTPATVGTTGTLAEADEAAFAFVGIGAASTAGTFTGTAGVWTEVADSPSGGVTTSRTVGASYVETSSTTALSASFACQNVSTGWAACILTFSGMASSLRAISGTSTGTSTTTATLASRTPTAYGVVFAGDGNSNTTIGEYSTPQKVSYRRRIKGTGFIANIKAYLKAGAGYSLGTGGTVILEIQSDDGTASHLPSGTVLASVSITPGNVSQVGQWTLPTPLAVRSGDLIHLVFRQTDASPTANFISLNGMELNANPVQHQPYKANIEQALLVAFDPTFSWVEKVDRYPIVDIEFTDGRREGQGYYDAANGSGQKSINGTQNLVRQNFTPAQSHVVAEVAIFGYKQSGTTQPLVVNLRNSVGTILATCSFAASEINTGNTVTGYGARWATKRLSVPVTLAGGSQYFLELSSPGETVPYIVFPVEGGGGSTFGTAFGAEIYTEGYLESTTNGGTLWSTHAGSTAWKMMAYFVEATGKTGIEAISASSASTTGTLNRRRNVSATSTGTSTTTATLARRRNVSATSTGTSTTTATLARKRALAGTSTSTSTTTVAALGVAGVTFPTTAIVDNFNSGASQGLWARSAWAFFGWGSDSQPSTDSVPTYLDIPSGGLYYGATFASYATTVGPLEMFATFGSVVPAETYLELCPVDDGNGYYLSAILSGNALRIDKLTNYLAAGTIATYTVPGGFQPGDSVGIRWGRKTSLIELWYKPAAGSWTPVLSIFDATYPVDTTANYLVMEALGPGRLDSIGGGTVVSAGLRNIIGTSTGTSTTTATLGRRRPLAATSTGLSTTTATLARLRGLAATSTGLSTSTATLARRRALTASSAGLSTTTATLGRLRPLSATSTGTSTTTATLARLRALLATSTGTSTTTATLVRKRALAATSAGLSTTTATLNRLRPLAGTSTGLSTTTATVVSQHAPVTVQLTATSTGISTTTATLSRRRNLAATSTGLSTTTALLAARRALAATSTGTSTTTATLARKRALAATSTGTSTTTAILVRKRALSATSTGTSTTTALLVRKRALSASSTGLSTTTAALARIRRLSATSTGTSTTTGLLFGLRGMTATSVGDSTTSASLTAILAAVGIPAQLAVTLRPMATLATTLTTDVTLAVTLRRDSNAPVVVS